MNCLEFRRACGADPQRESAELQQHRAQCPACEQYAREMLRLDGLIKRALAIPVPSNMEVTKLVPRKRSYPYRLALAASVTLMIAVGAVWFLGFPRDTLASDVVAHIEGERESMQPTNERIAGELLVGALRAKGLRLAGAFGDISYLQSCELRGRIVPHIVVQTDRGPVTVLLLVDEPVTRAQRFEEHGYRGILMPMQKGSVAVIALDAALVDTVADRVRAAIAWN